MLARWIFVGQHLAGRGHNQSHRGKSLEAQALRIPGAGMHLPLAPALMPGPWYTRRGGLGADESGAAAKDQGLGP